MAYEPPSKIRRIALDTQDWTPVLAPSACTYLSIGTEDGSPILRSSDPDNDEAWYRLSGWFSLLAPTETGRRFQAGDTVTYLKGLSDGQVAIVEFTF